MTQSQAIHIGMINSYNVLVNKADIQQIVISGIGVFSHSQDEQDAKISIEFMIKYFQDIEMYEKCAELQKYIEETFDEDGRFKVDLCSCEYPDVKVYKPNPQCSVCGSIIKRF